MLWYVLIATAVIIVVAMYNYSTRKEGTHVKDLKKVDGVYICPVCGANLKLIDGATKLEYTNSTTYNIYKCDNCKNKIIHRKYLMHSYSPVYSTKKAIMKIINYNNEINKSRNKIPHYIGIIHGKVIYNSTGINAKYFEEAEKNGFALIPLKSKR